MDASYDFDSERRVVIVTIHGKLTDQGLLEGYDRLTEDPRFRPDHCQLVDLRGAVGAEVTDRGVRALVERPPEFAPTSRRAIVVSSKLGFGMSRMYALLRAGDAGEVQVFTELDAAKQWLGID